MTVTALSDYQRLEAIGLWRQGETRPREVVVALGEATLTLRDPASDMVLAHWSLPAVVQRGATFAPGPDSDETLQIEDADMLAALDRVGRAVARVRPRPAWRRWLVPGALVLAAVGAAGWLAPGLIVSQTAGAVPAAERAAITRAVLADLAPLTGVPCDGPAGRTALAELAGRLFGAGGPGILILRDGLAQPMALPDGTILLPASLIGQAAPQALAGAALAAATAPGDPLAPVLAHAGPMATLRLMTGGALPADSLSGYGEALLRAPAPPDDTPALLAAMAAAGVASAPYGWWRDPTGETVLPLIEADRSAGDPPPVMSETDWLAIQAICG
jgi:hypothetical protein